VPPYPTPQISIPSITNVNPSSPTAYRYYHQGIFCITHNYYELIGALNKHQSEIENTINREINELKMKIDNIKEEVTHDMENLRKKNETEIPNTVEGHSSRLEKAENRISELEDEIEITRKTEELFVNTSRPVKGICKNSLTPSKDQT
jgi:SMC interacting uncharacterized protein involved in chromosome segregation